MKMKRKSSGSTGKECEPGNTPAKPSAFSISSSTGRAAILASLS